MNILCADKLHEDAFLPLREAGHDVVIEPSLTADELPERLRTGRFDVLVVRSTQVTAEALRADPQLALVVRAGAGTDNVDKAQASALGIYVCNVPGRNAVAVAELAMGLILAIDRNIASGAHDLRVGQWNKTAYAKADGILGSRLALIGLGDIGLALAERARAFGMQVAGPAKPGRTQQVRKRIKATGIKLVSDIPTLLASADIVSLHLPKSPDTAGLVDAEFLAHMKDGAMLINTARGDLVDAAALIEAMDERGIRAGLDVWPDEPSVGSGEWHSELAQHPNVVGSHHVGASTMQAQAAIAAGAVRVIRKYAAGRVVNCVNLVDEPLGDCVLTVRHHDRVGVLARVFERLRANGINVQQMQNQIFSDGGAATASINLACNAPAALLKELEDDPDVLGVSVNPAKTRSK